MPHLRPNAPMPPFALRLALSLAAAFLFVLAALPLSPASAQDAEALRPLLPPLAVEDFDATAKAINALAATGNPAAVPILEALAEGDLHVRKADGAVVFAKREGRKTVLVDPLTGENLGEAGRRDSSKIRVNNRLRRVIRAALGGLTLLSPDASVRRTAADAMLKAKDPDTIDLLDAAIGKEQDSGIADLMREARAAAVLASDRDDAEKTDAISVLRARGDRDALSLLLNTANTDKSEAIRTAAGDAATHIQDVLALWDAAQNVWFGLSLGSVLLLAAIGLAITFGVMGVINMAHGEMVMIGAYTTYVVQEIIRQNAPGLFGASLFIALPLAFLIAGLIGIAIERGVIRWLYGRPLETLLATWGISLILQQTVRSIFGPTNKEVGNPDWMAGAFQVGEMTITNNRLYIIIFSFMVLFALMALLKRTPLGLQMRAVTQNRAMASSMGIRTPWIDAMTFGLGSGIAGIAGVALSQIDNVSPNLGQSYIIDSFMVVVFGGVGNLWGTLVGAMTLGIANKFLEPYAGAVLGKILVLVFIILFIQKRPRGLFALRGRAVEA